MANLNEEFAKMRAEGELDFIRFNIEDVFVCPTAIRAQNRRNWHKQKRIPPLHWGSPYNPVSLDAGDVHEFDFDVILKGEFDSRDDEYFVWVLELDKFIRDFGYIIEPQSPYSFGEFEYSDVSPIDVVDLNSETVVFEGGSEFQYYDKISDFASLSEDCLITIDEFITSGFSKEFFRNYFSLSNVDMIANRCSTYREFLLKSLYRDYLSDNFSRFERGEIIDYKETGGSTVKVEIQTNDGIVVFSFAYPDAWDDDYSIVRLVEEKGGGHLDGIVGEFVYLSPSELVGSSEVLVDGEFWSLSLNKRQTYNPNIKDKLLGLLS